MGMNEWGIENYGHRKDLVFLYVSLVGRDRWNDEKGVHNMRIMCTIWEGDKGVHNMRIM